MKPNVIQSSLKSLVFALGALTFTATAAPPLVKTVPWVAANPLIAHSTYPGKAITLKGTCDQQDANLEWFWDFGDGTPMAAGTVTDPYAIEATHVYAAPAGTVFTARLMVQNLTTNETGSKPYYVTMVDKSLAIEVNIAIDEGLWFLHKNQNRFVDAGVDCGDWSTTMTGWHGILGANVNAFEVNGHLESGDPSNPYTETVQRGLHRILQVLTTRSIGWQALGNPDSNGNGYGVCLDQDYQYYQGGMLMDALVASSTPNALAAAGQAPVGPDPGILGRTYKDIVQDMVDDHAWAQYDSLEFGGWRYSAQDFPDNSACQWAVIGMIAAERAWGCLVPGWVKTANVNWLSYTQIPGWGGYGGTFGYTWPGEFPWGPYASTPSGMVQMVFNGFGRDLPGPGGAPDWDMTETFIRDNFGNTGGATYAIKDYYYGLFSFVKSMILYPYDGDEDPATPDPTPIKLLRSKTPGVAPLDWYGAETSKGDPTNGVARTLVNAQQATGVWWGNNFNGEQFPFETAWAIMMLQKTVFESGAAVAVAKAVPNPAVAGQTITLDGSDSFHQDAAKTIDSWEWDLNSDGVFDVSGPFVTASFNAVGVYPVKLRVTDNGTPEKSAETIINVSVTTPPVAPTADANGPYVFCPESKPWFLDGRRSVNPDEGQSELHSPPYPGDTIREYAWDLDGDGNYDDAFGPTPNVTAFFEAQGAGGHVISLRVTDTTATSYPTSTWPDLTSTTTAEVIVSDVACSCVTLSAEPLIKDIGLTWDVFAADHFNVHRSVTAGGPYTLVGTVPATDPTIFVDHPGILNQMYYYVVRPALANGDEICQSNEVAAEPLHPVPTVACTPTVMSNLAKYYYKLTAASQCFGRNQLLIYVGDTASSQVAGPFTTDKVIYIRTGLAAPSIRAGTGGIAAYVMTKGQARVWAIDPIGQLSTEVVVP